MAASSNVSYSMTTMCCLLPFGSEARPFDEPVCDPHHSRAAALRFSFAAFLPSLLNTIYLNPSLRFPRNSPASYGNHPLRFGCEFSSCRFLFRPKKHLHLAAPGLFITVFSTVLQYGARHYRSAGRDWMGLATSPVLQHHNSVTMWWTSLTSMSKHGEIFLEWPFCTLTRLHLSDVWMKRMTTWTSVLLIRACQHTI